MKKILFVGILVPVAMVLSPLPSPLWAADEVVDAYTGTDVRRDHTETDSLYKTLRNIYRPNYGKTEAPAQTEYKQLAPPRKWRYYGTAPRDESPAENAAIDGRYYKPDAETEEEKDR